VIQNIYSERIMWEKISTKIGMLSYHFWGSELYFDTEITKGRQSEDIFGAWSRKNKFQGLIARNCLSCLKVWKETRIAKDNKGDLMQDEMKEISKSSKCSGKILLFYSGLLVNFPFAIKVLSWLTVLEVPVLHVCWLCCF
jgi:hypothetical protein